VGDCGLEAEKSKEAVGREAAMLVQSGMRLGLGTGSTVAHFLLSLSERIENGGLTDILGVPSSIWTEKRALELGIPLTSLAENPVLDLTIDGADEVDPNMNLVKGLGGALLREKIIAQASRRLAIMVDESKLVENLGTKSPVPVEVVPFEWDIHLGFIDSMQADAKLRVTSEGNTLVTDNGNFILDCFFEDGLQYPEEFEQRLASRAGIVESGLFIQMATELLVGKVNGVVSTLYPKHGDL
jgi:ribose 5-phosphate isomerase A